MSCGNPMSEPRTEQQTGAMRTNGSLNFDAELANGLHAMAQPLTVVRGAIEVLRMPAAADRDPARYLNFASQQIERACQLFDCLQDLMTLRLMEARRNRFDLRKVVTSVVERHTAKLQSQGISLAATRRTPWRPAYGDPQRTEQAVSAALDAAAALASSGDTIELISDSTTDVNEFTISNPRAQVQRVDSSTRLYLFLAEENIISQFGAYQYTESPFCISLIFPVDQFVPISIADGPRPAHRPQLQ
jgi:signal transduction histidine kinase